jgi:hypothetical protein
MHKEALFEIFKATLEELYLERIYSNDNGLINKSLPELPNNKDVSFIVYLRLKLNFFEYSFVGMDG